MATPTPIPAFAPPESSELLDEIGTGALEVPRGEVEDAVAVAVAIAVAEAGPILLVPKGVAVPAEDDASLATLDNDCTGVPSHVSSLGLAQDQSRSLESDVSQQAL